jgi:hypothetical protein
VYADEYHPGRLTRVVFTSYLFFDLTWESPRQTKDNRTDTSTNMCNSIDDDPIDRHCLTEQVETREARDLHSTSFFVLFVFFRCCVIWLRQMKVLHKFALSSTSILISYLWKCLLLIRLWPVSEMRKKIVLLTLYLTVCIRWLLWIRRANLER